MLYFLLHNDAVHWLMQKVIKKLNSWTIFNQKKNAHIFISLNCVTIININGFISNAMSYNGS